MNTVLFWRKAIAAMMITIMFATTLGVAHAKSTGAAPAAISTEEVIASEQVKVDRDQLRSMLDNTEVREKLTAMGVDPAQVEERINNLTPQELAEFNQQLDEDPAAAGAGGVVGIIVLFLLVFIITDMLCATNVFNFVNCVN